MDLADRCAQPLNDITMSQQNKLTPEKFELNPEQVQFYMKLKEDRENYLNEMKKIYDSVLSQGFVLKSLELQLATIEENAIGMNIILNEDIMRKEAEDTFDESTA